MSDPAASPPSSSHSTAQASPARSAGSPPQPELRPHVYDGIQEFDQRLPNWWLFTLYITVVFSLGYWIYYFQLGKGKSDAQRTREEVAEVHQLQSAAADSALGGLDDAALWAQTSDPAVVEKGKAVYGKICYTCHANDLSATMAGAKLPGVPLNDAVWKYGSKPKDLIKLITSGTPDPAANLSKGEQVMLPKGGLQLTPEEVKDAAIFILSHHQQGPDGAAVPKAN